MCPIRTWRRLNWYGKPQKSHLLLLLLLFYSNLRLLWFTFGLLLFFVAILFFIHGYCTSGNSDSSSEVVAISGGLSVSFHANNASGKKPDHSCYADLSSIRYSPSLLFSTLDIRYLFLKMEGYCSGVFQTGTTMQSMVFNHMIQISNMSL